MKYYCTYCKDEEWVIADYGFTSVPCPMNCSERKKKDMVHRVNISDSESIKNKKYAKKRHF